MLTNDYLDEDWVRKMKLNFGNDSQSNVSNGDLNGL